jgi:vacuolar-type H+-ATPase subunit C/Vma6
MNISIENLDNPYVQIVWEDSPENFTQERIKRVKTYFSKKYNTSNVNVVLKTLLQQEDRTPQLIPHSISWIKTINLKWLKTT